MRSEQEQGDGGRLRAPQRTHLSLCVDSAGGGDISDDDVTRVGEALDAGLGSLDEVPQEFRDPETVRGCPAAIDLTGRPLSYTDLCCTTVHSVRDISLVSPHLIFVYFVPDDVYVQSFRDAGWAGWIWGAEHFCKGDTCSPVTISVYVPTTTTSGDLTHALALGLVRDPQTPEPTADWKNCLDGTPESWCLEISPCFATVDDPQCADFWEEFQQEEGLEPPQSMRVRGGFGIVAA